MCQAMGVPRSSMASLRQQIMACPSILASAWRSMRIYAGMCCTLFKHQRLLRPLPLPTVQYSGCLRWWHWDDLPCSPAPTAREFHACKAQEAGIPVRVMPAHFIFLRFYQTMHRACEKHIMEVVSRVWRGPRGQFGQSS